MAYDAARSETVVYTGFELWAWDRSVWRQLSPLAMPPDRVEAAMSYDDARQRIVMFGGRSRSGATRFADTWEWDGSDWTLMAPAISPPARTNHAMAYNPVRGRTLLVGGAPRSGAWEWDGTNWTPQPNVPTTSPQIAPALAFEPRLGVMLLVTDGNIYPSETWSFDGQWMALDPGGPEFRHEHGLAYDAATGEVVMFGFLDSTWTWDGVRWARPLALVSPPARTRLAMAGGPQGRVLMFGGRIGPPFTWFGGLWQWQGTTWTQLPSAGGPSARSGHAMAYDPVRKCTVLFGGKTGVFPVYHPDTWEWDGSGWQRFHAVGPVPRVDHAMAFDRVLGEVLLYGGQDANRQFADTWAWNGARWRRLVSPTTPGPRVGHAMAAHAGLQRTLLFGGQYTQQDTWGFDGSHWAQISTDIVPPGGSGAAMAYLRSRDHVVLFGGGAVAWGNAETWVLTAGPVATTATVGRACAPGGPPPQLTAFGRSATGNPSFALEIAGAAASAPAAWLLAAAPHNLRWPAGCRVLVDPAALLWTPVTVTDSRGRSSLPLPIPAVRSLFGATLWTQGVVLNAGSLGFTAGIAVVIGE